MQTEQKSLSPIAVAALTVCSREELMQMSEPSRLSFLTLIKRRLGEDGPPPTLEELQGIKELVVDHLSHPALAAVSPQPQTPTTTNQPAKRPGSGPDGLSKH